MSLDLYINGPAVERDCECDKCGSLHKALHVETYFDRNITPNLNAMFGEAGVYEILWRGDGLVAGDVLPKLEAALVLMKADEPRFRKFDAKNGWGTYPDAIGFLEAVVEACREYPSGVLRCSV